MNLKGLYDSSFTLNFALFIFSWNKQPLSDKSSPVRINSLNFYKETGVMVKKIATIHLLALAAALSACGGGGGGGATPAPKLAGPGGQVSGGGTSVTINGVTFSHDQAAAAFLTALNTESANETTTEEQCDDYGNCADYTYSTPGPVYAVTKSDTLQSGYAVVNDGAGHYMAVYIDGWTGSDPISYTGNGSTFTNLNNLGNGNFQDPTSGILFQASKPSSKDLEKQVAFFESLAIQKSAKAMQNYGFSEDRSLEVAKLASQLEKAPKGSMTDKDYDNFAKQITGSTITEIKTAMQKQVDGDSKSLKNIIDTAAETNGVGSEQMKQMLGKVVGHPVL